jgi:hypothetical protein
MAVGKFPNRHEFPQTGTNQGEKMIQQQKKKEAVPIL